MVKIKSLYKSIWDIPYNRGLMTGIIIGFSSAWLLIAAINNALLSAMIALVFFVISFVQLSYDKKKQES